MRVVEVVDQELGREREEEGLKGVCMGGEGERGLWLCERKRKGGSFDNAVSSDSVKWK